MNPAVHENACAAAHDGLGDGPLTVNELGLCADPQGSGRMAKSDGFTAATACCQIHERARNRRCRSDGDQAVPIMA